MILNQKSMGGSIGRREHFPCFVKARSSLAALAGWGYEWGWRHIQPVSLQLISNSWATASNGFIGISRNNCYLCSNTASVGTRVMNVKIFIVSVHLIQATVRIWGQMRVKDTCEPPTFIASRPLAHDAHRPPNGAHALATDSQVI